MSDYIIGVTGGVASGKSELTRQFEALGIVVADADLAAREAVARGSPGLAEIVAQFGPQALTADGELDRPAMRKRIFADPAARQALEAIVHPRVRAMLRAQCEAATSAYAIAAIPLLAEAGGRAAYPWLDRILAVDAPPQLQRERLRLRDGIDAELGERMIAQQASREARLAITDDVVRNDGSLAALHQQAQALHAMYLRLAAAAD